MKVNVKFYKYSVGNKETLSEKDKMLLNSIVTSLNINNRVLKSDLEILSIKESYLIPIIQDNKIWMWRTDSKGHRIKNEGLLSNIEVHEENRVMEIILDQMFFDNKTYKTSDLINKFTQKAFKISNITTNEETSIRNIEMNLVYKEGDLATISIIIKTTSELTMYRHLIFFLPDIESDLKLYSDIVKSVKFK